MVVGRRQLSVKVACFIPEDFLFFAWNQMQEPEMTLRVPEQG
jgi:hypothetical protein